MPRDPPSEGVLKHTLCMYDVLHSFPPTPKILYESLLGLPGMSLDVPVLEPAVRWPSPMCQMSLWFPGYHRFEVSCTCAKFHVSDVLVVPGITCDIPGCPTFGPSYVGNSHVVEVILVPGNTWDV